MVVLSCLEQLRGEGGGEGEEVVVKGGEVSETGERNEKYV